MRKVIGIGETVFDIIFKNGQPISGKPGGSVFNAMVSLGRMGEHPLFISEVGNDNVGQLVRQCMEENGVATDLMCTLPQEHKSAVALAFLDENEHPEYMFYTDYPNFGRLDYIMPDIQENDIILIGSFFALNEALREPIIELLAKARDKKAIVYYDVNFRKNLAPKVRHLMPYFLENMEYVTLFKGSDEDFKYLLGEEDPSLTYKEHIDFFTKNFIYTKGADGVTLFSNGNEPKSYPAHKVTPVSTVGAGDSFNAGVIYGLLKYGITYDNLKTGCVPTVIWDKVMKCGIEFSSMVCTSLENYISKDFADQFKTQE
ncbi:MAG: carbohydrate kinase [Paludibacteraceae bacterium]|nr:carbohydrate kinase [Paludibacteraceae bacterium]